MSLSNEIDIHQKFSLFKEHWTPKIIAQVNDYHIKIAKVHGEFAWHNHPETDELFLVIRGTLRIALPDTTVTVHEGNLFVVPKGVQHKPIAKEECHIVMFERAGTLNTGDVENDKSVHDPQWI